MIAVIISKRIIEYSIEIDSDQLCDNGPIVILNSPDIGLNLN